MPTTSGFRVVHMQAVKSGIIVKVCCVINMVKRCPIRSMRENRGNSKQYFLKGKLSLMAALFFKLVDLAKKWLLWDKHELFSNFNVPRNFSRRRGNFLLNKQMAFDSSWWYLCQLIKEMPPPSIADWKLIKRHFWKASLIPRKREVRL